MAPRQVRRRLQEANSPSATVTGGFARKPPVEPKTSGRGIGAVSVTWLLDEGGAPTLQPALSAHERFSGGWIPSDERRQKKRFTFSSYAAVRSSSGSSNASDDVTDDTSAAEDSGAENTPTVAATGSAKGTPLHNARPLLEGDDGEGSKRISGSTQSVRRSNTMGKSSPGTRRRKVLDEITSDDWSVDELLGALNTSNSASPARHSEQRGLATNSSSFTSTKEQLHSSLTAAAVKPRILSLVTSANPNGFEHLPAAAGIPSMAPTQAAGGGPAARRFAVNPRGFQPFPGGRSRGAGAPRRCWLLPEVVGEGWPANVPIESRPVMIAEPCSFPAGSTTFTFMPPSKKQIERRHQLARCLVATADEPHGLLEQLARSPFDFEANLLWVDCMLNMGRLEEAYEACRRAVHALQCSFHPKFSPFVVSPTDPLFSNVLLDLPSRDEDCAVGGRQFSVLLLVTLLHYARLLSYFGVHSVALEVLKLLISADRLRDRCRAVLHLEYPCVRLRKVAFLSDFCKAMHPIRLRLSISVGNEIQDRFIDYAMPVFTPVANSTLVGPSDDEISGTLEICPSLEYFVPQFAFAAVLIRLLRSNDAIRVENFVGTTEDDSLLLPIEEICSFPLVEGTDLNLMNQVGKSRHEKTTASEIHPGAKIYCIDAEFWNSTRDTDMRIAQLLLLRALLLFGSFLRLLLCRLNICASSCPKGSRSTIPWSSLIFSRCLTHWDVNPVFRHKQGQLHRAVNLLVQAYVAKNSKLWETGALMIYLHESASLLHLHYHSTDENERIRIQSTVARFRSQWFHMLSAWESRFGFYQKHSDTEGAEFELSLPPRRSPGTTRAGFELPDSLLIPLSRAAIFGAASWLILGNGNGHARRIIVPRVWINLHTNPVIAFFLSLYPRAALDVKDLRGLGSFARISNSSEGSFSTALRS